jgi:hypothetical protein
MMTFIEYLVNLTVYELLILGCSAPVVVLLLHFMRGIAGAMVSVVWFVGGLWIAHNAARRRVFGSEGFLEAIGSAVAEGRLIVSFLPVIGKLFPVRSRKRSSFEHPDDPASEPFE